jgi:hypothetical protein
MITKLGVWHIALTLKKLTSFSISKLMINVGDNNDDISKYVIQTLRVMLPKTNF